ncbi:MAG TPA: adenylate/guanylate cyclase domain-containing protein [Mycobacteriales bacterium]|nr:adenylate/guanylate cyclase domain-containing protein [Mycobacteriales bacterium]
MGALPNGLVTFMFTDVEGSTRLHRRLGEHFLALVAEHDSLLSKVVDRHGGTVVKWLGDGLFAAFSEAGSALDAALDVQRLVAAHAWPDDAQVRVRVGLHTGRVEPQGRDYVDLAVAQAARVAAAAHGGQVLLTDAVLEAAPGRTEALDVRRLGAHVLRDFPEPVELHQVCLPGTSSRFPPIRTLDPARRLLPAPADELVGREGELSELQYRLLSGTSRLVTLVGPPGVGKTRLALEVGNALSDRFPEGLWFVRLDLTHDPDEVAAVLAAAVRAPAHHDGPVAALRAWLCPGQQLLVVDNWEHVLDAAPLLSELLDACPRLVVLATSQRRLRLRAEHVVTVAPLELPTPGAHRWEEVVRAASAELFARRATAIQPFAVDDSNAAAVARICRTLEGIPLAVELCAGRVDELPLEDLADALDDQLAALRDGPRDLPERHRSLLAALRWSYRLLPAEQAAVLRRLAIFTGAFSRAEAVSVCTDPEGDPRADAVASALAELVDRSLVQLVDPGREQYRLLDSVHQFLTQELRAESEYDRAARRLLTHLIDVLGPAVPVFFDEDMALAAESADVALEWALSSAEALNDAGRLALLLQHHWDTRGEWQEGLGWLAAARAAVPEGSEVWAALTAAVGWFHFRFGDHELARAAADAVLTASAAGPEQRAQAVHLRATVALAEGDLDGCDTAAAVAQRMYRATQPDHPMACWLYRPQILAAEARDEAERARELVAQALGETHAAADPDARAAFLRMAAAQRLCDGDLAEGDEALDEAERLARVHGYPQTLALTLHLRAQAALQRGDLAAATRALDEAVALGERLGSPVLVERARCTQVEVAYRQDHAAHALRLLPRSPSVSMFPDNAARQLVATASVAVLVESWDAAAVLVATAAALVSRSPRTMPPWVVARLEELDAEVRTHLPAHRLLRARTTAADTLEAGGAAAVITLGLEQLVDAEPAQLDASSRGD